MAQSDDTSRRRRSRRNQPSADAGPPDAARLSAADRSTSTPPRNLEEALENVRTLMLQIRAVLHVLSDVLLYADDDDSVMHAEVARSTAGWANLAAEQLDLVKLRPLIEAIRRSGGEPDNGDPDPSDEGPHQVRESRPVYLV